MPDDPKDKLKYSQQKKKEIEDLISRDEQAKDFKEGLRQREFKEAYDNRVSRRSALREDDKAKYRQKLAELSAKLKKETDLKGQNSYYEYTTAIMDLIGILSVLVEAIYYAKPLKNSILYVWDRFGGQLAEDKFDKLSSSVKEFVKGQPKVEYEVVFDKDGVLETRIIANGKEIGDDLKVYFDSAIVVYAEQNGYKFDENNGTLKDAKGQPITLAAFTELNKHEETSMLKFFKDNFDINVVPAPNPFSTTPKSS